MATVDITTYHNEDLARDFVLRKKLVQFATVKKPTLDQTDYADLTGASFTAVAKFGSTSLDLVVSVVDAPTARIQLFVEQADIAPFKGKSASYDLLMTVGSLTKRLWGGTLTVDVGVTPTP